MEQSYVARPRSAAARELEFNVVGYGLSVRTFAQTDDPKFRTEAESCCECRTPFVGVRTARQD